MPALVASVAFPVFSGILAIIAMRSAVLVMVSFSWISFLVWVRS